MGKSIVVDSLQGKFSKLLPLAHDILIVIWEILQGKSKKYRAKDFKQKYSFLTLEITKKTEEIPKEQKIAFNMNQEVLNRAMHTLLDQMESYDPATQPKTEEGSLLIFAMKAVVALINIDPNVDLIVISHLIIDMVSGCMQRYVSQERGYSVMGPAYQILGSKLDEFTNEIFRHSLQFLKVSKKMLAGHTEYANVTNTKDLFEQWGQNLSIVWATKQQFYKIETDNEQQEQAQNAIISYLANYADTGFILQGAANSFLLCIASAMIATLKGSKEAAHIAGSSSLDVFDSIIDYYQKLYNDAYKLSPYSIRGMAALSKAFEKANELCTNAATYMDALAQSVPESCLAKVMERFSKIIITLGSYTKIGNLYGDRLQKIKHNVTSKALVYPMAEDAFDKISEDLSALKKAIKRHKNILAPTASLGKELERFVCITLEFAVPKRDDLITGAYKAIDLGVAAAATGQPAKPILKPVLSLIDNFMEEPAEGEEKPKYNPKPPKQPYEGKGKTFKYPEIIDYFPGSTAIRPQGHSGKEIITAEIQAVENYNGRDLVSIGVEESAESIAVTPVLDEGGEEDEEEEEEEEWGEEEEEGEDGDEDEEEEEKEKPVLNQAAQFLVPLRTALPERAPAPQPAQSVPAISLTTGLPQVPQVPQAAEAAFSRPSTFEPPADPAPAPQWPQASAVPEAPLYTMGAIPPLESSMPGLGGLPQGISMPQLSSGGLSPALSADLAVPELSSGGLSMPQLSSNGSGGLSMPQLSSNGSGNLSMPQLSSGGLSMPSMSIPALSSTLPTAEEPMPSMPAMPSLGVPAMPSLPSVPAMPAMPTMPVMPSMGSLMPQAPAMPSLASLSQKPTNK